MMRLPGTAVRVVGPIKARGVEMERIVEVRDWFIGARGGFFVLLIACLLALGAHTAVLANAGCGKCGQPACSSCDKPCECKECVKAAPCNCGECQAAKPCGGEKRCQHWGCEGKCRQCCDECGEPLPMKDGSCITPSVPDQGCWELDPNCCPREDFCLLCGAREEFKLLCCAKPKCCPPKEKPCKCKQCGDECQHLSIDK